LKLHRKVALKVLRPELASALGPDRFLQEIDIAAKLNHPHVLGLFDCGEAGGFLYFVMPYVDGESLRDRLAKEGELPVTEALRILRDVVDALSHAHKHNVVHRDIKPDNVMLSERHALVTDFGVSKAVSEATGRQKLTTEGVALGTPTYMSPEQAAADPHIDHRADIYAVGAVAYELLTGRPPFTGTSPQMILSAHLTDAPEPVTKYRETVTPALAQLVMKCLEKKAADRWQSAEELLQQLEALATPSGGTTPVGTVPVDRVVKRRWMLAGAVVGVAVVIALIVVMAGLPRGSDAALDPNHVVVAVLRNETGDPSLEHIGPRAQQWIIRGLQDAAIPITPWDLAQQSSDYVAAEAEAGRVRDRARALADETGAGTVVSGAYYLVEGDSLELELNVTDAVRGRSLGVVEPVRGARTSVSQLIADAQQRVMGFLAFRFDEARDWAAGVTSEPPSFEAYQAFDAGQRARFTGPYQEAFQYFLRAHELDSTWVQPLIRMSWVLLGMGRYAEHDSVVRIMEGLGSRLTPYERAEVQSQRALAEGDHQGNIAALRRASELAPHSTATHNLVWYLIIKLNRPRDALELLSTFDSERVSVRKSSGYWQRLFVAHMRLGEHEQALDAAVRARRELSEPGVAWMRSHAGALAALGRVEDLHRVLEEIETSSGDPVRSLVEPVEVLRAYGHEDSVQETVELVIRWLEARSTAEVGSFWGRHWYGRALFIAGRRDEARELFDLLVEEVPGNFETRAARAYFAVEGGDTAQARRDLEWIEQMEIGEGQLASARYHRGIISAALGDLDRALELMRASGDDPVWGYTWAGPTQIFIDPLREFGPYQEFMRPKG